LNLLGGLAALFYVAHAAYHVHRGTGGDLFWACNIACPMLAIGCFAKNRWLCAAALCFLAYGLPMWLLDISTGGDFVPTSILTHVGGTTIAVLAVRRLGFPRFGWAVASGITLLLLGITRLFGDPARNANLAFRVHDGWERWFPSHTAYLAMMWLGSALVFFVVETAWRRVGYARAP
jgi:hypothetical protein